MKTITLLILLLFSVSVHASKSKDVQKQDQKQLQGQDQIQKQGQGQTQSTVQIHNQSTDVSTQSKSKSKSSANNEGVVLSTNTLVEASAPDIVMVPNNNTSSCQRVYGLSFSNQSGGGGIGWPYRDKSCDFEQAGDDAAANGQHTIAWFWRCHKKNLYKQFNGRAEHKEQQIQECHRQMMSMFVKVDPPDEPSKDETSLVTVNCEVGQHPKTHERIFMKCQEK